MPSAHVTSIEAVREFRAALIQFAEEAGAALESMSAQIHRALDWVEHQQPAYWQQQIKLAFDDVAETRMQLETCRLRTVAGHRPLCIEEKQNHRRAKQRLEYCQQMVPKVKRWTIKFRHEADEYRGRMGQLNHTVKVELPRMIALIDRTATALEKYAEMDAPPVDELHESTGSPPEKETA